MNKYKSGSGWHYQSVRHSLARRTGHAGGKYALDLSLSKKPSIIFHHPKRLLVDMESGDEFSADAGDYWDKKKDFVFKGLALYENGELVKNNPTRADLIDEIYEEQDTQKDFIKKRKSQKTYFLMEDEMGRWYTIDKKGRIASGYSGTLTEAKKKEYSDTWAITGIKKRMNEEGITHFEDLKQQSYDNVYLEDLDNGTTRQWGKKIRQIRPISS